MQRSIGWMNNDRIRLLLSRFRTILLLSAMTGFSFAVFAVLNSYIFQLDIFDMRLTQKQPKAFNTKRVYTILILEVFISSWNIRIFVKFLPHICIHRIKLSWCLNLYFWYNQWNKWRNCLIINHIFVYLHWFIYIEYDYGENHWFYTKIYCYYHACNMWLCQRKSENVDLWVRDCRRNLQGCLVLLRMWLR